MTQSTSNPSLSNGSDSNATQDMPNSGMYMGQFPWPQPAYTPYPNFYYPYGVAPNAPLGTAPTYAPAAPSPDVGTGAEHHAFQAGPNGYYPPALPDVSGATYDGPYPPLTGVTPQQHLSAPPLNHQPFPSSSFPGAANHYAPPAPHQGYTHQYHGPGLPTAFAPSFVPEAPSLSVGQKRVAEDFQEHHFKRIKIGSYKINDDPLFKPVLDQYGQPDGTFVCCKDGMILHPESYRKHLKTRNHLGFKLIKYKCPEPSCAKTYTRRDACKRHWDNGCGKLAPEGARLSYSKACLRSMSFASAAPATVPATAFAYSHPCPMPVMPTSENVQIPPPAVWAMQSFGTPTVADPVLCVSQSPENDTVTEPAEDNDDEDDADFWEANEIQDAGEI
ncbi:hypothetical protein BD769DRAFT_1668886 [Suillus cothurnatus]|nr:hypothetical protein BD769DRAFT_1668886 [Suillus cothurnatus]